MTTSYRFILCLFISVLLAGCATHSLNPPGDSPIQSATGSWIKTELYFGRSIEGGSTVTDADWHAFVSSEISSAFPDGFTVIDAKGQWRDESSHVISEDSKVVIIVYIDTPEHQNALDRIVDAYKTRFQQRSVLRVSHACEVAF